MPDGSSSNRALDAIATRRVICCEGDSLAHASGWLIYMNIYLLTRLLRAEQLRCHSTSYSLRTQAQQARQIPRFAEEN